MSVENNDRLPLKKQLSEMIKSERLSQGLTQKEVADRYNAAYGANWCNACVSDIEHGRFSFDMYEKVLILLDRVVVVDFAEVIKQ